MQAMGEVLSHRSQRAELNWQRLKSWPRIRTCCWNAGFLSLGCLHPYPQARFARDTSEVRAVYVNAPVRICAGGRLAMVVPTATMARQPTWPVLRPNRGSACKTPHTAGIVPNLRAECAQAKRDDENEMMLIFLANQKPGVSPKSERPIA
jgi:hypothetical protein